MAHKKGQGSTRNGRDSNSQRLGVKRYADNEVKPGMIIIRQRGTEFKPGKNVGMGKDYTIFSKIQGYVKFEMKGGKRVISVYPTSVNTASEHPAHVSQ